MGRGWGGELLGRGKAVSSAAVLKGGAWGVDLHEGRLDGREHETEAGRRIMVVPDKVFYENVPVLIRVSYPSRRGRVSLSVDITG